MKIKHDKRIKWFVPFYLFISVIFDAALPAIFPVAFLGSNQIVISQLTLYMLTLFCFYFKDSSLVLYAGIFGLLVDSYNTTVLGLYASLYILLSLFILNIKKYLPKNSLMHLMLFIISIFVVQFAVFVFYRETGHTTVILTEFLALRLWPTIMFNLVLSFMMYFPSKWVIHSIGYDRYIIM